MKIRTGFVSNSSSSSFIITNITNEFKTLVDFAEENSRLLNDFINEYEWHKDDPRISMGYLLEGAKARKITFYPKEKKTLIFGDEDETVIGMVYDYMLREGGKSKSFTWRFHESLR